MVPGGDEKSGKKTPRSLADTSSSIKQSMKNIDLNSVKDTVIMTPNKIRRSMSGMTGTQALVKAPVLTVVLCLVVTGFFTLHSGAIDCREQFQNSICNEESSMNVNGDLEVYLPDGSQVAVLIEEVEEDWTTNVMIIYVESDKYNISLLPILEQIDAMENAMNYDRNDGGENDEIIYVLSLSAVIKEVNSSAGRVAKAFTSGLGTALGQDELAEQFNEIIDEQQDILGNYAIPDEQNRVDQILGEMPQNALDKLVRDVGGEGAEQNLNDSGVPQWNRAVIIMGISSDADVPGIIELTQSNIDNLKSVINESSDKPYPENTYWSELGLNMTLTGPAPITNAVTEESFNLFWNVFPIGVVLVAITLFLFIATYYKQEGFDLFKELRS